MYIIFYVMEVCLMTYKFMNGWLVKIKDIDKIKKFFKVNKFEPIQ